MVDETEDFRKEKVAEINANPGEREALEREHGEVLNTGEMSGKYEVLGFMAPYVAVKRKSDNQKGSLMFQDRPRYYFGFIAK